MPLDSVATVVSERQQSDPDKLAAVLSDRHSVRRCQKPTDRFGIARRIEKPNEVAIFTEDAHNSRSVERSGLFCDLPEGRLRIPPCGRWPGQWDPPTVMAAKTR